MPFAQENRVTEKTYDEIQTEFFSYFQDSSIFCSADKKELKDTLLVLKQKDTVLYDAFHIITELVNKTSIDNDMKLGLIITLFVQNCDLQIKSANHIATDETVINLYVDLLGIVSNYRAECLKIQNYLKELELKEKQTELKEKQTELKEKQTELKEKQTELKTQIKANEMLKSILNN